MRQEDGRNVSVWMLRVRWTLRCQSIFYELSLAWYIEPQWIEMDFYSDNGNKFWPFDVLHTGCGANSSLIMRIKIEHTRDTTYAVAIIHAPPPPFHMSWQESLKIQLVNSFEEHLRQIDYRFLIKNNIISALTKTLLLHRRVLISSRTQSIPTYIASVLRFFYAMTMLIIRHILWATWHLKTKCCIVTLAL